jgi:hypothetical protein
MSAVAQNQPLRVEIKGFKTGHFVEGKKGLGDLVNAGAKRACGVHSTQPTKILEAD